MVVRHPVNLEHKSPNCSIKISTKDSSSIDHVLVNGHRWSSRSITSIVLSFFMLWVEKLQNLLKSLKHLQTFELAMGSTCDVPHSHLVFLLASQFCFKPCLGDSLAIAHQPEVAFPSLQDLNSLVVPCPLTGDLPTIKCPSSRGQRK